MAEGNNVTLVIYEGGQGEVEVQVDARIANLSGVIKDVIQDSGTSEPIPIFKVSKKMLNILLEFAQHHNYNLPAEIPKPLNKPSFTDIILDPWDIDFVKRFTMEEYNELMAAADFLNFTPVIDLMSAYIASQLKGKEVENLLEEWGITEEFTPEEEDKLKQENPWAFEGEYELIKT